MIEITSLQTICQRCNAPYDRFTLGKSHVYATCKVCNVRDEVGLVIPSPDRVEGIKGK
jgi:hypothetical protein